MNSERNISIDVMRGLTIALMILVNTPGSWSHVYAPLLHADWHGATPTDFVFPFFLFIVGCAMFFSFKKHREEGSIPWSRILKRTGLLFLTGVFLNIYPFQSGPESWRIMGVLQRIALCYFCAAILILTLSNKQLIVSCFVILAGYWGILEWGSVDPYSLEHNLIKEFDIAVFSAAHIWQGKGIPFDPEGLLSSLPAMVSLLAGYLTCKMLSEVQGTKKQIRYLLLFTVSLSLLSFLLHPFNPINKSLWTSTYVLLTTSGAMGLLACITYLREFSLMRWSMEPLRVYGTNPLFIYLMSWIVAASLMWLIKIEVDGQTISAYHRAFLWLKDTGLNAKNASLAFALINVLGFYLLSYVLYRKQIFIKL